MRLIPCGFFLRSALSLALCLSAGHFVRAAAPDLDTLAKGLKSADAKQRAEAADALGDLGPEAKTAGPALVTSLKDPAPEVRWRAARALANIGAFTGKSVADALVAGLGDEDATVRAYSCFALATLGMSDKAVVEVLAAMVANDKDPLVRRTALKSLRRMKLPREVTIPLFVKTLSAADPEAAMAAVQTIAGGGEPSVAFLRDALAEPKAAYWACLALAEIGPAAKDAAPEIAKLLTSKASNIRLEACMALGAIGAPAKAALPSLAKVLAGDQVEGVRYAAAYAIGGIATPDPAAIAALQKVGKSDAFLTTVCAWALARVNPQDEAQVSEAVALLIDGLKSPKTPVRLASVEALQGLQSSADIVGPALVEVLKDPDAEVASEAIEVLGSLGPKFAPEIIKALAMPNLRSYALQILGQMGPAAKTAVPDLIALLDDPQTSATSRREIQFALGQIGPAAVAAMPQLIKSLDSDDDRLRNSAIFALGHIGPAAKDATPALEKLSDDEDDFLRIASLWALVQINPTDAKLAAKAAPSLAQGLASNREMVRAEAARVLGMLGSAGKMALPALKKQAATDSSPTVVEAAKKAIAEIESGKSGATAPDASKTAPNPPKAAPAPPVPAPPAVKPIPAVKPAPSVKPSR